jgi:hypothetical protein
MYLQCYEMLQSVMKCMVSFGMVYGVACNVVWSVVLRAVVKILLFLLVERHTRLLTLLNTLGNVCKVTEWNTVAGGGVGVNGGIGWWCHGVGGVSGSGGRSW